MPYRGHLENGVVVVDEPIPLPEGTRVTIEPVESERAAVGPRPLRGTPYRFDDPFQPAAPAEDWDALR